MSMPVDDPARHSTQPHFPAQEQVGKDVDLDRCRLDKVSRIPDEAIGGRFDAIIEGEVQFSWCFERPITIRANLIGAIELDRASDHFPRPFVSARQNPQRRV